MPLLRKIFFAILILNTGSVLYAQQLELLFQGGMGSYAMTDLKSFNAQIQRTLPFETVETDNFPMTVQPGLQFAWQITPKYKLGLKYAYNSTGSRLTTSDYSGSYYFDNVVTGHTIGIVNSFLLYNWNIVQLNMETNFGVVSSIMKINENLQVYDTIVTTAVKYTALGFFVEPRLEASFQWKHLKTGIYAGYFINPWGKLKNEYGEKTEIKVSWSGIRFGIEIGIGSRSKDHSVRE